MLTVITSGRQLVCLVGLQTFLYIVFGHLTNCGNADLLILCARSQCQKPSFNWVHQVQIFHWKSFIYL